MKVYKSKENLSFAPESEIEKEYIQKIFCAGCEFEMFDNKITLLTNGTLIVDFDVLICLFNKIIIALLRLQ